jgi:hypothetical protein
MVSSVRGTSVAPCRVVEHGITLVVREAGQDPVIGCVEPIEAIGQLIDRQVARCRLRRVQPVLLWAVNDAGMMRHPCITVPNISSICDGHYMIQ